MFSDISASRTVLIPVKFGTVNISPFPTQHRAVVCLKNYFVPLHFRRMSEKKKQVMINNCFTDFIFTWFSAATLWELDQGLFPSSQGALCCHGSGNQTQC